MRVEIGRDSFFEGLTRAVVVTEKRTPLPILSHVLVEASDDKLTITATDLEVGLKIFLDCQVADSGSLTVPARKAFEIVRELPSSGLTLETTENNRISIVSGASHFELPCMESSDYPAFPSIEEVETTGIPAEKLLRMIEKSLFAASTDDSRFNLNGVLFEQVEGKTRLVATDGHRLALINEETGISLQSRIIGPKKGLLELRRILEGLKGDVQLGFEKKNLFIRTERMVMTVRLIDGDYPDYRKVIPGTGFNYVRGNRSVIMQSLRRVAVLTSDRNKGVQVRVEPGRMEIQASHADLGTARDSIEVEYSGDEFEILINVAYLLEGLGALDSDMVAFEFYGEGAPVIMRPEPLEDYFNLVMPMRK